MSGLSGRFVLPTVSSEPAKITSGKGYIQILGVLLLDAHGIAMLSCWRVWEQQMQCQ